MVDLLVSTAPSEYFSLASSSDVVITELWEALVAAQLIDASDTRGKQNHVLEQLLDVFDCAVQCGIPSVVLDTFREASSDAAMEHCGITIAECVLKWIARSVEACAAALEDAPGGYAASLRDSLVRSEAAREAAEYALSWQDMERSFHQIKSSREISSGPMSQSVVQNFKELAGVAAGVSMVIKCKLVLIEVAGRGQGGDDEDGGNDSGERLERCRQAETSLFASVLKRYGFLGTFSGKRAEDIAVALAMHYLEGRKRGVGDHGGSENDLLALLVYCLRHSSEQIVDILATYFPTSAEDLRVWALAPLLDESLMDGDDVPLHRALKAISSGTLDCRRMPMAYLMALLRLGQSALVLSLLYQKWIDPNNAEDVLGCIEILMHEDLVIECYVHVKQYLRQLRDAKTHNNQGYQRKVRTGLPEWRPLVVAPACLAARRSRTRLLTRAPALVRQAKLFWQTMFAAGAARGMLFQLIRLPIASKDEEAYIVEWLQQPDDGFEGVDGVDGVDAVERRKALCLYYLIRGRTEEATRELRAIELDPESDWDRYLEQLCALASQGVLVCGDVDHVPEFARRDDSGEATPGLGPTGGLLFGVGLQSMDTEMGNGNDIRSASVFDAPPAAVASAAVGLRGRVAMSLRASSKVHQLDRVLGFE